LLIGTFIFNKLNRKWYAALIRYFV
jgi:hypothetical protein